MFLVELQAVRYNTAIGQSPAVVVLGWQKEKEQ
jgi:hypothetical protein